MGVANGLDALTLILRAWIEMGKLKEGDEVIVFDHNSTAAHVAEHAGTISYELITSISTRIKRLVIDKN